MSYSKEYIVYGETGDRRINHIQIREEELSRLLKAFETGEEEYFLDGKLNYINENSRIKIFELYENPVSFIFDKMTSKEYLKDIEGTRYLPLHVIEKHGKDVTNQLLLGAFGYKSNPSMGRELSKQPHLAKLIDLHPRVIEIAQKLFVDGHYRAAVLDTYIGLIDNVKIKSGKFDLDGSPLMQNVFSERNPILRISDDADEQRGFMWLFSGAVMGVRNSKAHKLKYIHNPQEAIEWLSFASLLFSTLDKAILDLRITSAKYHGIDCAELLNSKIINGKFPKTQVDCIVGSDPAYGVQKKLEVEYHFQGKSLSKQLLDGEFLELP